MRTRSQTRNRNRQQQSQQAVVQPFHLEEPFLNPPLVPMADNWTMAQLLHAPTEGYEDAIVIPEINANFKLKHGLINLVQNKQFFGHDKEDHIRYFNKITSTMRFPDVPSTSIKLMLFPFSLEGISPDVAALTTEVSELKNLMKTMLIDKQKAQAPATVKAVEQSCVTCGGAHSYKNCPATDGNVYQDNIQEYVSQAAAANFNQGNSNSRPPIVSQTKSDLLNSVLFPSQTITNPREHVNAITTRSGTPNKPRDVNKDNVQKPSLESTHESPPPEEEESIFMEIPKPKAKKTVNIEIQEPNSPKPTSYQPKLPYPERMKVRENDKPSAQHSRFLKMFKQLRLEIGLKDALVEMPKFNKWLSGLLRNKEKLEEIAITTVNAECSAIILNKVPEKLEDPGKFLIPCALQELDRTNALADSGASINLLPHSIYKQLGLGALTPTRMTLELANRSITHPIGIAEDVVVRVDGFTFLADFVVVNFEPDPRVPIILGRPFLRTAKALIDLYEEKLTLRVGSDELVFYAKKSEKSKNKQFAHAISVIDFEPFSGSTTNHSDALPPSSSLVKTSEILEEFADELTLPKKVVHEENFQVYSNPLFEFDDNFTSSNENPLFNEMDEDVVNKNSNVLDEPVLLNSPLTNKVECSDPEDDIDEIDAFLAMEVSSNFEEGYFDSEGDVTFLENLLSDDTTHNITPEVISDHEPKQDESIHNTSITFSPRSDPLHHEFAGELMTLPSRIVREHEDYLNRMTLLCEIFTFSNENDDSEDEDNELPNLDHQDNPSSPRPPPEPPDVCLNFKPATAMRNEDFNQGEIVLSLNVEDVNSFTFVIWTFLPFFTYLEDSPVILSLRNEDLIFYPGISTFHFSFKPVPFALPKDE
ncbi:reverse transcriptase domain-containing protein [Tanacetum coccineum]